MRTSADFYRLTREQIAELEGYGEVSADKLIAAIEASREQPFGRVLFALGIEGVGWVTGRNLAQRFRTVDALLAATPEQIAETPGIGPKVAELIHRQLADEQMRALIDDLRPFVRFEEEGPPPGEGPLARQDVRAHRHAARPHARAGDGAHRRRRRQGHLVGVEEDRLRRRGRLAGLQAREGRAPRRRGARRGRAARRCCPGKLRAAMADDPLYVVVEIPKGSSNKYEWDDELGAIKLDRLLFSSLGYPTDYGFFRDTLAADGDPLDAMVVVSEPTFPGCFIEVKPVALFRMRDENAEDNKILCVPFTDPNWSHIETLDDLPTSLKDEISHFFSIYKTPEWKVVKVDGWYPKRGGARVDRARPRALPRETSGRVARERGDHPVLQPAGAVGVRRRS